MKQRLRGALNDLPHSVCDRSALVNLELLARNAVLDNDFLSLDDYEPVMFVLLRADALDDPRGDAVLLVFYH